MISMEPVKIDDHIVVGIVVMLPKTTLIAITTDIGYIMCGALDIELLNVRLKDRHIIAGRAVGVRTINELLEAPLESITDASRERGIIKGMIGREALKLML